MSSKYIVGKCMYLHTCACICVYVCVCVCICMYKENISIYINIDRYMYIIYLYSYRKTFSNRFLESRYISITASLYLQVNCAIEVSDLSNIEIFCL